MPEAGPPGSRRDPFKTKDGPLERNISLLKSYIGQFEMACFTVKLSVSAVFSHFPSPLMTPLWVPGPPLFQSHLSSGYKRNYKCMIF